MAEMRSTCSGMQLLHRRSRHRPNSCRWHHNSRWWTETKKKNTFPKSDKLCGCYSMIYLPKSTPTTTAAYLHPEIYSALSSYSPSARTTLGFHFSENSSNPVHFPHNWCTANYTKKLFDDKLRNGKSNSNAQENGHSKLTPFWKWFL